MVNLFLPLVILATPPQAPIDARHPDAIEVYHCDFGEQVDANHDLWPDDWTRRRGPDYPGYLEIAISKEPSASGNRCLRIDLDGGAAAAYSSAIDVSPLFSYVLEGFLKTENLKHDVAYYSITFCDATRKPLEIHRSALGVAGLVEVAALRIRGKAVADVFVINPLDHGIDTPEDGALIIIADIDPKLNI